jgi:Eukaryotic DNA topoisomerase I, DNA binding fragment.
MYPIIELMLNNNYTPGNAASYIDSIEPFNKELSSFGISRLSLETALMIVAFKLKKAPVMTLRQSLNYRLIDLLVSQKIPISFVRAPFPVCYIEFGEPEFRNEQLFKIHSNGKNNILEGAYLYDYNDININELSQSFIEEVGLVKNKKTRLIDIGFSSSPFSLNGKHAPIYFDLINKISIYIQDEDESLETVLDRHLNYYCKKLSTDKNTDQVVIDNFSNDIKKGMDHLLKALLYLNSDNRIIENDFQESGTKKNTEKTTRKKGKIKKFKNQMMKRYDRILVGPKTSYTPLSEIISRFEHTLGKRPHYRRGYFALRHTGHKGLIPKIVRIPHVFVNASKIPGLDITMSDYDIK